VEVRKADMSLVVGDSEQSLSIRRDMQAAWWISMCTANNKIMVDSAIFGVGRYMLGLFLAKSDHDKILITATNFHILHSCNLYGCCWVRMWWTISGLKLDFWEWSDLL
jgi:hypothetical protein